jgi:hypothetical protein
MVLLSDLQVICSALGVNIIGIIGYEQSCIYALSFLLIKVYFLAKVKLVTTEKIEWMKINNINQKIA